MAKSTGAKSGAVSALDYLSKPEKHPAAAVCVVSGDEAFLKREVLGALRRQVLSEEDSEFSLNSFAGKTAELREVRDALAMVSLFGGGRRLVIVEEADPFVTRYRGELEDYVARPAQGGVLVLEVKSWPGNTRLAKAVAATGLAIACEAPNEPRLRKWLGERATAVHGVRLDASAADALLELVPPELGILDQELARLALLVGPAGAIDVQLVRENVGGWRTRTTWEMIDAAADGHATQALEQVHRLLSAGEKPHGLLPQMSATLRRFATATRLVEAAESHGQKLPLRSALQQAGVPPFKLGDAERQLRQIGRERARQIVAWLLAADLAMKSHNSSDERARIELERLVVRLAAGSRA